MNQGYVHVYTGDGKGKSTAAFGLALRAMGADKTVRIIQFMKKGDYSELKAFQMFGDRIRIDQFGSGTFVRKSPSDSDKHLAAEGLALAESVMEENRTQLLILDEVNVAASIGLVAESDLLRVIRNRPGQMELVLTGRYAPETVRQAADLVTEMTCVKHYFEQGVPARVGIEM